MLFGIFTGDTGSYSLSVFCIFPEPKEYRTQTVNMNPYPLGSPNNKYILLRTSCTNIKEYIILYFPCEMEIFLLPF